MLYMVLLDAGAVVQSLGVARLEVQGLRFVPQSRR